MLKPDTLFTVEDMSFTDCHSVCVVSTQEVLCGRDRDVKSCFSQPVCEIHAVSPHVVFLSIEAQSLLRVRYRWVFGGCLASNGNHENGPSCGLQDSPDLPHRFAVIGHMFEHVATVDRVEEIVGILNVGDVHFHHCIGFIQVCRHISLSQLVS